MYDSAPEEYSQHLQIVGQEMLNGSLDKVGAVIRLVRFGWSHEEAHAAVNEIAEQVETTNKLIRDAARILDDSPSGKARASARLREAGFTGNHAEQLVEHLAEHRQQSANRQRDMIQSIRRGKISRAEALEQLVSQGMDPIYANLKMDMATDSCTYWSAQWYKLSVVIAVSAVMSVVAIASYLTHDVFDWIGVLLLALLACSSIVLYWAWQNHRFWQDWTLLHQSQRDCPRSCSPFVMLAENKGRQATIMTATEWGLPRMAATELVREKSIIHAGIYRGWMALGVFILILSLLSSAYCAFQEPEHLLLVTVLQIVLSSMSAYLIFKGYLGRRAFLKS